jgi:hypothetical protein
MGCFASGRDTEKRRQSRALMVIKSKAMLGMGLPKSVLSQVRLAFNPPVVEPALLL